MSKYLFLVLVVWFQFSAIAAVDINCIDGDCLTYGWNSLDTVGNGAIRTTCIDSDCRTKGWIEESGVFGSKKTLCHKNNCFQYGWDTYGIKTNKKYGRIRCNQGNCHKHGWSDLRPPMFVTQVKCILEDCARYGWDVFYNGRIMQTIRCKGEQCFKLGYTQNP